MELANRLSALYKHGRVVHLQPAVEKFDTVGVIVRGENPSSIKDEYLDGHLLGNHDTPKILYEVAGAAGSKPRIGTAHIALGNGIVVTVTPYGITTGTQDRKRESTLREALEAIKVLQSFGNITYSARIMEREGEHFEEIPVTMQILEMIKSQTTTRSSHEIALEQRI